MSVRRSGTSISVAVVASATAAVAMFGTTATALGAVNVRVANTHKHPELVKTIPIARGAGSPRVVMSLSPSQLGELQPNDRLESSAEVEASVCLKPEPKHPGSERHNCIGRNYGYDPKVRAQLVLAAHREAAGGGSTTPISPLEKLKCRQKLPNRNHHCVLVIDSGRFAVPSPNELPCPADDCHVNLVMTATHKKAKKKHKLVIGSASSGKVVQDKGAINVARIRPGGMGRPDPLVAGRSTKKVPIVPFGRSPKKKVIASLRIDDAEAGEALVVDASGIAKIGRHRYNAFVTSSLVLGERPTSTRNDTRPNLTKQLGKISKGNGFNCTQGSSAHRNPCTARKVGVLEFLQDSNGPVYVNMVTGMQAQFPAERHKKGDKAKVTGKTFVRAFRYSN